MKMRTIGAIILLVILIGSIIIGYEAFGLVMLACSILGYNELIDIKYKDNERLEIKNKQIKIKNNLLRNFFIEIDLIYCI